MPATEQLTAEDDVFAAARRACEEWDLMADVMDGAFLMTDCPDCTRRVNALVRDDDHPHIGLFCPMCRYEWTERVA